MQGYILVIDDDEAGREFVISLLTEEGYTVRSAADAYQALDALDAEPPSLLVLDLMMPGVSGVEFLSRLRLEPLWEGVPVILTSAHPRLREIAQDLNVQSALTKPFDITSLMEQITRIIGPGSRV
ncbi:MAG: response regulator [Chloroflexia bacterium]